MFSPVVAVWSIQNMPTDIKLLQMGFEPKQSFQNTTWIIQIHWVWPGKQQDQWILMGHQCHQRTAPQPLALFLYSSSKNMVLRCLNDFCLNDSRVPKWQGKTPKWHNHWLFSWIGPLPAYVRGSDTLGTLLSEYFLIFGDFSGISWALLTSTFSGQPSPNIKNTSHLSNIWNGGTHRSIILKCLFVWARECALSVVF